MMRDRKVEAISTKVAVKAVWMCDGRINPQARVHLDRVGGENSVEGNSATVLDSTGIVRKGSKGGKNSNYWNSIPNPH
jgi:hypothetical protein